MFICLKLIHIDQKEKMERRVKKKKKNTVNKGKNQFETEHFEVSVSLLYCNEFLAQFSTQFSFLKQFIPSLKRDL